MSEPAREHLAKIDKTSSLWKTLIDCPIDMPPDKSQYRYNLSSATYSYNQLVDRIDSLMGDYAKALNHAYLDSNDWTIGIKHMCKQDFINLRALKYRIQHSDLKRLHDVIQSNVESIIASLPDDKRITVLASTYKHLPYDQDSITIYLPLDDFIKRLDSYIEYFSIFFT